MEYRRARTLMLYWHDGELTAENYLRPEGSRHAGENAVVIDALTVRLLEAFGDWTTVDKVAASFPEASAEQIQDGVEQLAEHGLLLTPSECAGEDTLCREWRDWGEEARFFHYATKDADYYDSEEELAARANLPAERGTPPAVFKTYPSVPRFHLPRVFAPMDTPFVEVLTSRRTHRFFTERPVDIRLASTLLFYTFSPMYVRDADVLGQLLMKTSPSGGARHELEGYVAVFDVAGVEPGLYHYNAESHALERLAPALSREQMSWLSYGAEMTGPSAMVCFITAVIPRTTYKYHHARNYRVTLLNAGHLVQTFALTATALGLGPWQTLMFRDSEIERLLGIDGYSEVALYMAGVGHPHYDERHLPSDLTFPPPY